MHSILIHSSQIFEVVLVLFLFCGWGKWGSGSQVTWLSSWSRILTGPSDSRAYTLKQHSIAVRWKRILQPVNLEMQSKQNFKNFFLAGSPRVFNMPVDADSLRWNIICDISQAYWTLLTSQVLEPEGLVSDSGSCHSHWLQRWVSDLTSY